MTSLGEPVAKRRAFGLGALIVTGWYATLATAAVTADATLPVHPCDGEMLCFSSGDRIVFGIMAAAVGAGILLAFALGVLGLLVRWVRSAVWAGVLAALSVTLVSGCALAAYQAVPR